MNTFRKKPVTKSIEKKNLNVRPPEKKNPRLRRWIILLIASALPLILLLCATDNRLTVRRYTVVTDKIDGTIRVVMVSDLHSAAFGDNQEDLIRAIKKEEPDVVVLSGICAITGRPVYSRRKFFAQSLRVTLAITRPEIMSTGPAEAPRSWRFSSGMS